MRRIPPGLALLVLCTLPSCAAPPPAATAPSPGEFIGPLAGWGNVKTDYGAVGDGKADDTAALQKAFDEVG